jgi:ATP-dependent RNA helicase DHX37/DHR1
MPKFVPRQRKHKVVARQKSHAGDTEVDANAPEILPVAQRQREERKAAMKSELVAEKQGKMSGKKKKRLDKYIVRIPSALHIPTSSSIWIVYGS